ncbi:outer membrane protein assembly factor BamB family protein [Mycobacterium sp. NPDC004974]
MSQWGSSPWGDNDGQPGSSPFGPPVFGAAPGFPSQPPGYGYPPQFTPPPPEEDRRRRAKVIGMIVAAVVVVVALVVGGVLAWTFGSGSQPLSEADTAAGRAEIAAEERPPGAVKAPTLTSAPTTPLWTYPPGGNTLGLVHVLGGDAKTVIIMVDGSMMVALDAANGSPRWQQPLRSMQQRCVIGTSGQVALCTNGGEAILIDMATGVTKESKRAKGGPAEIYGGAGVLAANLQEEFTVFDDRGRQLWSKPLAGRTSVFLDQGIVAGAAGTTTTFYDAKTGDQLFAVDESDGVVATSRGIAVSVYTNGVSSDKRRPKQHIDFYSFTGKLAWRIPADRGYRLPSTTETGGFEFRRWAKYSTSGVTSPIVYNQEKNEIAGVDALTGELTWTQQIPLPQEASVSLGGFGNLCVVSYTTGTAGAMRVRDCSDGTGAFLDRSKIVVLIAANGTQILGNGDPDPASRSRFGPATAFDSATGRPLWQLPSELQGVTWVGEGLYCDGFYGIQRLA